LSAENVPANQWVTCCQPNQLDLDRGLLPDLLLAWRYWHWRRVWFYRELVAFLDKKRRRKIGEFQPADFGIPPV
jgi:hypothetical protein